MAKSKQNKVPEQFERFYAPLLKLKQVLQSNNQILELDENQFIVHGLMVLHYATFIMCNLYRITDKADNTRALLIRSLIENMLEKENYSLDTVYISKISSFIDSIGKYLNTVIFPKSHIAMYHGYLDYEIYYQLHKDLGLFDFKWCCTIEKETVASMKNYHDASLALLEKIDEKKSA